jgi:hypothetical protein
LAESRKISRDCAEFGGISGIGGLRCCTLPFVAKQVESAMGRIVSGITVLGGIVNLSMKKGSVTECLMKQSDNHHN